MNLRSGSLHFLTCIVSCRNLKRISAPTISSPEASSHTPCHQEWDLAGRVRLVELDRPAHVRLGRRCELPGRPAQPFGREARRDHRVQEVGPVRLASPGLGRGREEERIENLGCPIINPDLGLCFVVALYLIVSEHVGSSPLRDLRWPSSLSLRLSCSGCVSSWPIFLYYLKPPKRPTYPFFHRCRALFIWFDGLNPFRCSLEMTALYYTPALVCAVLRISPVLITVQGEIVTKFDRPILRIRFLETSLENE